MSAAPLLAERTVGGRQRWLILALVWLVALNLRSGLIGVSPVLPLVQRDLRLDHAAAQVIFTLPLAFMCLFAVPGGILVDRLGARRIITAGLVLLAAGEVLRVAAHSYAALFADTLIWSLGLGAMQPSLPKLVQEWFPDRSQVATGIYTSGFIAGAGLAGWLTDPFLLNLAGSWRGTFAAWGLLSAATCVLWWALGREAPEGDRLGSGQRLWGRLRELAGSPEKARQIRWVAALLAAQSLLFYSMSAWLPTYLYEQGWSLAGAAGPYTLFEVMAIPSTVLGPVLMDRLGRRRPLMVVFASLFVLSVVGLAALPRGAWVWAVIAGATNPLGFVMGLALPVEIAPAGRVGSITGVTLTVAYAAALGGPPLAGLLRDVTGLPAAGLVPALMGGVGMAVASAHVPERAGRT